MQCLASSFADPADVRAFVQCKARGRTDAQCYKVGDNGIGTPALGGLSTAQTRLPMCALPPDDIEAKFGSVVKGRSAIVDVTVKKQTVRCILADVMPRKRNITNGCGIDLNPAAAAALGLKPPFKVAAEWNWHTA